MLHLAKWYLGPDPTCTILPIVPTEGDPLTELGACAVDVNQDDSFGGVSDSCTGNVTASQCSVMKTDPKYLVWSTTTCPTLLGAIGNTSGTCCLFQGFGHMGCESVSIDNCTGMYEPFLDTGEAACPDCTHDAVCNSTRPSGCDSAFCDIDTRICRCARVPDDDSTTTVLLNTEWVIPVLAAVLFGCFFIAICYMWGTGFGSPRRETVHYAQAPQEAYSGVQYQGPVEFRPLMHRKPASMPYRHK